MHYLSLGFIAAIIASLGYVERAEAVDARILINHAEAGANWCNSVWPHACTKYAPKESEILSNLCEPGDYSGNNAGNTSLVVCSVGSGQAGQLTLITHYVVSKLGATPVSGDLVDGY